MSGGHFTTDELRAIALGEDESQVALLTEHLQACARCGDQLAVMLALAPAVSSRTSYRAPIMTLAGILVFAVLAVALLPRPNPPTIEERLAQLATDLPPAENILEIHVRMSQAIPADATGGPSIREGADRILEGDYDAAAATLEREMFAHPSSELVALYWGMARYLSGDDAEFVGELLSFASESRNQSIAEFAAWYLANHLLRTGDVDGSLEVLDRNRVRRTNAGKYSQALLDQINETRAERD